MVWFIGFDDAVCEPITKLVDNYTRQRW